MISHGSAGLDVPVTEADVTRCKTARMMHRVRYCGESQPAALSDLSVLEGKLRVPINGAEGQLVTGHR